MKDLYWVANYADGTKLEQFSDEGKERRYEDIKRDKLVRFDIFRKESNKAMYSLYLREDQRLIYRRRTLIEIGSGRQTRVTIYLVGWQVTIMTNQGPRNITSINYIHEDGSVSLDGTRSNLELLDFEK